MLGHDGFGDSVNVGVMLVSALVSALGFGFRSGPGGGVGCELFADGFNDFFVGVVDYGLVCFFGVLSIAVSPVWP